MTRTLRLLTLTLLSVSISFLQYCSPGKTIVVNAEPQLRSYEVLKDRDSTKMLRGIITREQITQDTAFKWYAENLKYFKPNAEAIAAVKAKADKIHLLIFGGTWCEDSHQLLPKYLSVIDGAQLPADRFTLIAVDRAKTTIGNLHKVFNITNVPTCIVMYEGKEVGRIVEFGKTALVDKELGEMVAALK